MTRREILDKIKDRFKGRLKNFIDKSYKRTYVEIAPSDITDLVGFVFNELGARFNTASCIDGPEEMEILYHFTFDEASLTLSIRVYIDKTKLEIDSITSTMKGAEWIEREIHELFGVDFKGHPNLKKLLLPDDWPEGSYPLRRDYEKEGHKAR